MKKVLLLVLCMAVLVVQSSLGLAKNNIYSEDEAFIGHAKQYVEKLNAKNYDAVYKDFVESLQQKVPKKGFIDNTESLFVKAGSFKKIDSYSVVDGADGSKAVVVSAEYRNENMKLTFLFDKDFAIFGFNFAFYMPEGAYLETDEQLKVRAKGYLESLFADKNSAAFYKDMDNEIKKGMSEKALVEKTENLLSGTGDFIKITDTYITTTHYGYKKVAVYSEHEKENSVFTVVLNANGKVDRFTLDAYHKYPAELVVKKENYQSDELVKRSLYFIDTLNNGDVNTLFDSLSKAAKEVSSLEDFAPIWYNIYNKAGKVEHVALVIKSQKDDGTNIEVLVQNENNGVIYVFFYDKNDELEFFNTKIVNMRSSDEI